MLNMFLLNIPIVLLTLNVCISSVITQVVHIEQGTLRGFVDKSRNGRDFYSFIGIPYAKPPVNKLRLKFPEKHSGWTGERNATEFGPRCLQKLGDDIVGNEDCLYLNVYTPKIKSNAKLPVMVYIHGGAMIEGNGDMYRPNFLMNRNVVVVTFNYRLGVLGFMSFVDDIIPGNFGLRDQLMVLQWIQNNIVEFGGNPLSVTLFGESAGGASVDILLISPLSEGLFHRAIAQSGTATCPWAIIPQEKAKSRAEAFTTIVDCSAQSTNEILSCLQEIPSDLFISTYWKFAEWQYSPLITFGPTIDSQLRQESFLPLHPLRLSPKKVPIMIGVNNKEGNMLATMLVGNDFQALSEIQFNRERRLLAFLGIRDQLRRSDRLKVFKSLDEFYLEEKFINKYNMDKFIDLGTDLLFAHPAYKTALNYYKKTPVYFYLNDVETAESLILSYDNNLKGPNHGDELLLLFNMSTSPMFPKKYDWNKDAEISNTFVELWTNFAKNGYPNEDWKPVKSDKLEYFLFKKDKSEMKSPFLESRMKFINTLPLRNNEDIGIVLQSSEKVEIKNREIKSEL